MTEPTHIDVGVEELCPGVARQHVDDDHLAPLLHVDQEVAQFPVVLVDQVDPLRAHLLKGHDHAACHQLWCSETGVQYSETRLFAGNRIVKLSQSFSVATICHDLKVKGGWLREAAQSLIGVHFVSLGQFVSRKYEGGKKKTPTNTHSGFVSEELLDDFNQLVLLFWIQTEDSQWQTQFGLKRTDFPARAGN